MKNKYIIIYPWKFVDSLYNIFCLDTFSDKTEVLVLDISSIFNKKFSDNIAAPSALNNVKRVDTLSELAVELRKIRKCSRDVKACVNYMASVLSLNSLFISLLAFLYLRNSSVKVLKTLNYGFPVFKENYRDKILFTMDSGRFSLRIFLKKLYYFSCSRIPSPMSYLITHQLVAGKYYEKVEVKKNIKVIKGHCHNYSRYLSSKEQISSTKGLANTIVFIDAPGPFFNGDNMVTGNKMYKSTAVWYPLLCHFFDRLESIYEAKVVISAHYLSDISKMQELFGGREIFSGCTNKLVAESKLVVTEQSSAVAFAVIYKKPVLFVYSDELKSDLSVMRFSDNMSKLLGQPKININHIDSIPARLPTIDEMAYRDYKSKWLTSNPEGLTNAQLIELEIF